MSNRKRARVEHTHPKLAVFPDLNAAVVLRRTRQSWDLDSGFPLPRGDWLACPVCRGREVQGRFWQFFLRRPSTTLSDRCDVYFKCALCCYMDSRSGAARRLHS
jgi:hypothetical protein